MKCTSLIEKLLFIRSNSFSQMQQRHSFLLIVSSIHVYGWRVAAFWMWCWRLGYISFVPETFISVSAQITFASCECELWGRIGTFDLAELHHQSRMTFVQFVGVSPNSRICLLFLWFCRWCVDTSKYPCVGIGTGYVVRVHLQMSTALTNVTFLEMWLLWESLFATPTSQKFQFFLSQLTLTTRKCYFARTRYWETTLGI